MAIFVIFTICASRAIEYLAGLPPYVPRPWDSYGFVPMDLSPDSALKVRHKTAQDWGRKYN